MRWGFVLWGQPPSWNSTYRIASRERRGKDGRVRLGPDGKPETYRTLVKTEEVAKYQRDASIVVAAAKPSRWAPQGQVRIYWDLYLSRDIDCDNVMKAIHDVIAKVTRVDDARFLPCVRTKTTGVPVREARVEIVVEGLSPSASPDRTV